jgi:hypothetical protein
MLVVRPFRCTQWLTSAVCCSLVACSSPAAIDDSRRPNVPVGGFDNAANAASGGTGNVAGAGDNPTGLLPVSGSGSVVAGSSAPTGCKGLQCQQHACTTGATTVSGRVYDPAGKNPLYNIAVYIPNEAVGALTLGASCARCDSLYTGKAVVSALTDAEGRFTLKDAPDGSNIPLVIQIGKWRRQFTIPSVQQCQDTAMPDKMLSLPRNQLEGDIPSIAISTGAADTLECLLRRVGLDASEYVPGATGSGRIHIFQGSPGRGGGGGGGNMPTPAPNTAPAAPLSPAALWNSSAELMKYDIVLLSCEGQETPNMNQQALHDYASAGGRVFASHFHYSWFNTGPYGNENLATWTTGSQDIGNIGSNIVTTFPKGKALADWLQSNGALVNGELPIEQARHNADVSAANMPSQAWITANQSSRARGATQYFSFNTPTDAGSMPDGPGFCGRVVFSDLHVGAASHDNAAMPVPTGCASADLSPQEKALEFMLFDLSSCVIPDDKPPLPPPVLF